MTTTTTRRAIMAGAAALPVLAAPATAVSKTEVAVDPIFAAIETHRAAFVASMGPCKIWNETVGGTAEYDAIMEAARTADDVACEAANILTELAPTTFAGVSALLDYVEDFNAHQVVLPDDPEEWFSCPMRWPARLDENETDLFAYAVLSNVRRAFVALAVRS
jgi:hypothetical protein